ncbi:unnamed protein product [Orchesella dallaii]|uniref:Uncharacterized protein n=1 Tax=Orchesella dallaii TaxID=48710 RepID=A0ABP1QPF7_9HEXA
MGYNFLRYDRPSAEGGGTVMYIQNSFNCEMIEIPMDVPHRIECNLVKLSYKGIQAILLVVIYIPPQCVNSGALLFLELLFQYLVKQRCEFLAYGEDSVNGSLKSLLFQMVSTLHNINACMFPLRQLMNNMEWFDGKNYFFKRKKIMTG